MSDPIDYTAVLADLEAKRGQIDAAIAVIRAMLGSAPTTDPDGGEDDGGGVAPGITGTTTPAKTRQPAVLQSDTFFGLNTSAAIRKYLGMMKRPQTARVITEALRNGGQINATDLKIAYGNVYTALTRNKDFVKTRNKEWGLAEWYSNKAKTDSE